MIPVILPGCDVQLRELRTDAWPDAAHHLLKARRLRVGEKLLIGDGEGSRALAEVVSVDKFDIGLKHLELLPKAPPPPVHLWLCILEKSALEEACHLVSQVGVAAIHLVQSDFTVAPQPREKDVTRLEKIILNSCIQSEQAWLPELMTTPMAFADLPLAADWCVALERHEGKGEGAPNVLIGPEGGWSPAEREKLLGSGVQLLDLGAGILRAQTAALVSCWSAAQTYNTKRACSKAAQL